MFADILVAVLILAGSTMALTASIGILRFGDTMTRMHAATKPQTLGLLLILVAAMIRLTGGAVGMLVLACLLALITAPVVAHRVGRLAYLEQRRRDDLLGDGDMESRNTN